MGVRSPIVQSKLKVRSAVSNGTSLLPGIDGRSREARRYRDLFQHYLTHSGGSPELCRQAAALVMQRELLDAALVRGEHVDPLHLTRLAGAITRTITILTFGCAEAETERRRREVEDREAGLA